MLQSPYETAIEIAAVASSQEEAWAAKRVTVRLFEGVYKSLIEMCIRLERLGDAIQYYEAMLKVGQVRAKIMQHY